MTSPPSTSPTPPPPPAPPPVGGLLRRESIPNLLTVGRLVLAVALFAVLTPWRIGESAAAAGRGVDPWLLGAAALFIVAAATDALDGYLARKWNVVSVFGRIMDPFADKLLVIGAFVFLAGPGFWWAEPGEAGGGVQASGVYPWMVAVILGRELLVTSIRGTLEGQGIPFPATASGKWKMILQSVAVPVVLVLVALGGGRGDLSEPLTLAIRTLVWITVLVTAWSGVPYVFSAMRALRASTGSGKAGGSLR